MNKIFNWTIGSFFRSIGRILAYVVIGSLIGYFLSSTGFKFTDLFIMRVYAEEVNITTSQYNLYVLDPFTSTCSNGSGVGYKNLDTSTDLTSHQGSLSSTYSVPRVDYYAITDGTFSSGITYALEIVQSWNPKEINYFNIANWTYAFEGSTTNSTSGLNSANIDEFSCYVENINNAYQVKLHCNFVPRVNLKTIYWRVNTNCGPKGTSYFNTYFLKIEPQTGVEGSINDQTNQLIDNSNTNTQTIINNNNQNTQAIIDSNKVCSTTDIDKKNIFINHSRLNDSGVVQSGYTNYGVTDYIEYDTLELLNVWDSNITNTCFYTIDKQLISCSLNSSFSTGNINIPNARYFRSTIFSTLNRPTFRVYVCKNGSQALDDTLNDDNVDESTSELGDFFEDFTTNTHGLTGVITAPLNAINSLTSSTCSSLVLPLPFINENLTLPCMRTIYDDNFGGFMDLYDVITLGIVSYWVSIRIFNLVKDFKNPDHDEIEVMDL